MIRSRILGTGAYLPPHRLDNTWLESRVDTTDAWIRERTGVAERRIAPPDLVTSDLAAAAARVALDDAGLAARDLDMVIVATVTPDMPMPATACFVQRKLGAAPCAAFDLGAACAGFIYGLGLADGLIRGGGARHVLVIGVEVLSRVLDWSDRTTCVLFGDAAGAAVLGPSDDPARGVLSVCLHADGDAAGILTIPGGGTLHPASADTVAARLHKVHMNGREVFRHAVRNLAAGAVEAIEAAGLSRADVDHVVAHQANARILQAVAQRANVPFDRFFINIEKYGNTSSASIPVALDEARRAGRIVPGQTVLMCALGAGVAWGSALVRM
jgi:3-oxoacyl-[acyl-carrier-protein] synthase-3